MKLEIATPATSALMEPLTFRRDFFDIPVAGTSLKQALKQRYSELENNMPEGYLQVEGNLWPSRSFATVLSDLDVPVVIVRDSKVVAYFTPDGATVSGGRKQELELDKDSFLISYSWDILAVNEDILVAMDETHMNGVLRENVVIDGCVDIGEGTVLLPGVYIEGNVVIGKNCKIGPNCYIRGNTSVGDNCHIGQAVEVKNSILMDNVGAGHLSYIGDSIVCNGVNLGAGTITANFRHDGKNHRSAVKNGTLIDTGRRKFGSIIGDNVHTGIHTSIYPGRKIWPDVNIRPGTIIQKDLHS